MVGKVFKGEMVIWSPFEKVIKGCKVVMGEWLPYLQMEKAFKAEMGVWAQFERVIKGCRVVMGEWLLYLRAEKVFKDEMGAWSQYQKEKQVYRIKRAVFESKANK